MKIHLIFIPEKLNLKQIVSNNPPEFDFNFDYAYSLIYQILKDTTYNLKKISDWKAFYESKPVNKYKLRRCSTVMQSHWHNYNKYLDYFHKNSILWREPYTDGVCRKYQLAPKYFCEKVRFYSITDLKVIKIYNPTKVEKNDNPVKEVDFHPLNKWFSPKLKIDCENAIIGLNESFEETRDWCKYLSRCRAVTEIQNCKYYFSRKKMTDDRFHSTMTGIPKNIRKHLRYEGKRLGEVDISSSVPFFLYYHLLSLVDNSGKIKKPSFDTFFKSPRYYSKALKTSKSKVVLDANEVIKFGEVLLRGDFYRQFTSHFDEKYYIKNSIKAIKKPFNNSEEDRIAILKMTMLSVLNAKNNLYLEEQDVLKKLYPTIFEFLKVYKTRRYLGKPEKNRLTKLMDISEIELNKKFKLHKKVAHLCLQTESYFMLDVLVRKLNKSYCKIPFFTLHDCIITTEENLDFLWDFMSKTFIEAIGFSPNFKSKTF
ncbi:hypothetical protein [Flavobacterium sp.]|uniref:hypothetical protein n=1 Tax=Flavobacterium sp. TaxID=239 RepID=UPI0037522684